jgi:hypothetical protein
MISNCAAVIEIQASRALLGGPACPVQVGGRLLRTARANLLACSLAAALTLVIARPASAIDLKIVEDGASPVTTVTLSGTIAEGDGLKVRGFIGELAASKPIVAQLAFAGGVRTDAMSIGRFFHQLRIRTVVAGKGTRCISPCPLVLVGGREPVTGKASHVKHSNALVGFTGVRLNYQDKEYTVKDLDMAVASTQREILQIADYLHAVKANLNMLRYYQSVLRQNEVKYLTNEEALDLGIAVLLEETGQLIEPIPVRRN